MVQSALREDVPTPASLTRSTDITTLVSSETVNVGTIRNVAPAHHCWLTVPVNSRTPLASVAWMSPWPPSKNGASGWYLAGSMTPSAKSSENTVLVIWADAGKGQASSTRTAAAASKRREA